MDPIGTFTSAGEYTYVVTATAADGCGGADSVTVKVFTVSDIFVPGAFTPNGDGHNDMLRVLPVSIKALSYFRVYDRFGQLVFNSANLGGGWDGSFNGHQMPAGIYVWAAGGIDYTGRAVERKGTVLLIR